MKNRTFFVSEEEAKKIEQLIERERKTAELELKKDISILSLNDVGSCVEGEPGPNYPIINLNKTKLLELWRNKIEKQDGKSN